MKLENASVFILTGEWNDFKGKNVLRFIGASNELGPVELIFDKTKPVFFIERNEKLNDIGVKYLRKSLELMSFNKKKRRS